MRPRRLRRKNNSGAPGWMVTYSDMVTLILVFFILLFSMSRIDLEKFETISESFRERVIFDFLPSAIPLEYPAEHISHSFNDKNTDGLKDISDVPKAIDGDENSLESLMESINKYLDDHGITETITANRTERGVVLVLQDSILFETGEAEILETGKPFLKKVGELLMEVPNHVKVEGHTDIRPINSYRYPSNWELSGARASSVIRYLLDQYDFDRSRFSLAGYGETRPIQPNDTQRNMQKNRRVEIIILDEVTE